MADIDGDGYEDDEGYYERNPDADRPPPRWEDYNEPGGAADSGGYEAAYDMWRQEQEGRNARRSDSRNDSTDIDRLPPNHPRRVARDRAEANARWDAMSWEERQAARGRGETRDGGYGGGGGGGGTSDFDRVSADIPIWGDLSGARARMARAGADAEAQRRAGILGDLAEFMPSEDELSAEYRHEGEIGPGAESLQARDALAEWSEGGFTDTDRAMMDEQRRRAGMAARADREANMSALEARGMGGSGATLASMLSAGEGAADRGASVEASMMGAAQDRQYQATNALGAWGAREDDYARGREGRNTTYDHSTAESAAEAAQQAHENRSEHTSFALGGDPNAPNANDEEDEADDAAGGLVSGIWNSLFG